jgi:hypothetical protein
MITLTRQEERVQNNDLMVNEITNILCPETTTLRDTFIYFAF